jgi:hypothetical protein
MATKLTVVLVGGIVIVALIVILIIESLTSPSPCMPHSTNLPSLGDKFAKNSTSQTPFVLRNIIIVPPRKCGSGEKRDKFGVCRKKW